VFSKITKEKMQTFYIILFLIFIIYFPYFIYRGIRRIYWLSIVKKSQIDFYKVKKFKIYLPERNSYEFYKKISKQVNPILYFNSNLIVGKNEFGSVPGDEMRKRYELTLNYLNDQFRLSKEEFINDYYEFDFTGKEAIQNIQNIIYYYLKAHKLGEAYVKQEDWIEEFYMPEKIVYEKYYNDSPYYLHLKTKHIQLSINIKEISRIKGNMDSFKLFCLNQVYQFEKRKIIIRPLIGEENTMSSIPK
jgi:hypothetical protein